MRSILVAVAVLCLSLSASAEEAIGPNDVAEAVAADVTPVVEVAAPVHDGITLELPFYWEDLSDAGVSLLGIAWKFLFTIGGGWILTKIIGSERAKSVTDALSVSVDQTWDQMGRAMKHAAKDRKLDAGEREELRSHAKGHALTILKGAALKLFQSYSSSKVNALIASSVEKRKARSAPTGAVVKFMGKLHDAIPATDAGK